MGRKKYTEVEKQYFKQVKRIRQFISRAEKRGYKFKENILPEPPKRITKASVRKLGKLTPDKLYEKAVYGGAETYGEIVPAKQGRKLERSASAKKAAKTRRNNILSENFKAPENVSYDKSFFDRVVISGFKNHVSQFNPRASELLLSWLSRLLETNSEHDVAVMLNDGMEKGLIINYQIVYSSEKLAQYMSEMLDYLPEAGPMFKADFMEAMEEEEDFLFPI